MHVNLPFSAIIADPDFLLAKEGAKLMRWLCGVYAKCHALHNARHFKEVVVNQTFKFAQQLSRAYIIPPAGIAGAAGAGSGMSTIPHSVVRNMPATEAAFSRATRATFVGSMTPASYMFTYSSVRAL